MRFCLRASQGEIQPTDLDWTRTGAPPSPHSPRTSFCAASSTDFCVRRSCVMLVTRITDTCQTILQFNRSYAKSHQQRRGCTCRRLAHHRLSMCSTEPNTPTSARKLARRVLAAAAEARLYPQRRRPDAGQPARANGVGLVTPALTPTCPPIFFRSPPSKGSKVSSPSTACTCCSTQSTTAAKMPTSTS
jgi:hypothetical protein